MFLDDVFEHCSSPSDLFRNIDTSVEIPITLKRSKLDMPVFRSTERSKDISPTRAVSSDTITVDGRRVFAAAGFRQRFTFYCLRRGMTNALHDGKFYKG
jgi:hypothetical protein